eukprot:6482207-Amphidinium_carterae.2
MKARLGHRSMGIYLCVYNKIGAASSTVPVSPNHADWVRSMSCSKLKLLQHEAGAVQVVTAASKHPLLLVVLQPSPADL